MEEKSLSWWGDVTTTNKEETIKKNGSLGKSMGEFRFGKFAHRQK